MKGVKNSDVKLTINSGKVKALEAEMNKALTIAMAVLQDRIREAQVIPRDTGALQGEKFYLDDSEASNGIVRLVHEGPYARRLYYHPEYDFRQDQNPYAQGLWFSLWQEGGVYQNEPVEFYENALRQILKGDL